MLKAQSAPQPKGRKRRALAAVRNELKRRGLVYHRPTGAGIVVPVQLPAHDGHHRSL